jgi:hypothetical protein
VPQGSARRLPVTAGAAVVTLAVAALGACGGHGSSAGSAADAKSLPAGGATVSPAPPGKYQTLPQPCVALDPDSLKQLVPGAEDYSGTESLTYDTDRRVGCAWQARTPDGTSRSLSVDFDRVVSYDPGISDEVQAEEDFDQQATAHQIAPSSSAGVTATPTGGTGGSTGGGTGSPPAAANASGASGTPAAPVSSGAPATAGTDGTNGGGPGLAPRHLTDLGNDAFVDDVPKGSARREVTVVFRTANVLVTVVYSQTAGKGAAPPDSASMQKGAQEVAAQLERKVEK